jgi:putative copper export protein
MLIEMYPLRKKVGNFFAAKAIGAVIMVILIPIVFYSYTAFTEEILAVDIATFMVAVAIGQIASYRLFRQDKQSKSTEMIAVIMMALLAMLFIMFTFYPPHLPIFRDSSTGGYGI